MKKPLIVVLVVLLLIVATGGGWWWYQSSQQKGLTLYGNVDIRTVNMSFRVGGRLASLSVDEGDAIKAGQNPGPARPCPL
ncbi:putative efflux pump membrane fusion protein [Raoultella terrigena]|uniref:Putative efflux pump membrane fusion protein n=1 Tax=Raoultella terrigena TaxID=577 RepID=A0A485B9C4_RAOTE|nr:putative efflux pump membrane fusion protein [Raoultella terrigena]